MDTKIFWPNLFLFSKPDSCIQIKHYILLYTNYFDIILVLLFESNLV